MAEEFIEELTDALRLMRRRDFRALGELPQLRNHRRLQTRLGKPINQALPVEVGATLAAILKENIAALQPASKTEDPADPDWRCYTLLNDYYLLGHPWKVVADRLGVGRARFYEIMASAVDTLALPLLTSEGTTRAPRHNLRRPMYRYVQRSDEEGKDLVEKVIQGLNRRPWVVSIRGFPGTGKTTLGLEAAWRCVEHVYFDAVIWIEQDGSASSLEAILNSIAQALGVHGVVIAESLVDKQALVIRDLTAIPKCLIVIDNSELLDENQHRRFYDFIKQIPISTSILLMTQDRGRASQLETVIELYGMAAHEAIRFMRDVCQVKGMMLDEAILRDIYNATSGIPASMLIDLGLIQEGHSPKSGEGQEVLLEAAYSKLAAAEKTILHVMPVFATPVPQAIIAAACPVKGELFQTSINRLLARFLINEHEEARFDILAPMRTFLLRRSNDAIALLEAEPGRTTLETLYRNVAIGYHSEIRVLDTSKRESFLEDQWGNILPIMQWCYDHHEPALTELLDLLGYWLGLWGRKRERLRWAERTVAILKETVNTEAAAWHLVYDVGWTYYQLV
jgi:hypothetical protein